MISRSDFQSDTRVRRESEALNADGHHVTFVGTGPDGVIDDVTIKSVGPTTGLLSGRPKTRGPIFRAGRWALMPNHQAAAIRNFREGVMTRFGEESWNADVVHAHDFPALGPAVAVADQTGASLVYDAHELWAGMARGGRPSPSMTRRVLHEEGALSRKAAAVLTVSQGAARHLQAWHSLDEVTIVRNTFPSRGDLEVTETPKGLVYAGRIAKGRDLQTLFDGMAHHPTLSLSLIGPKDPDLDVPTEAELFETAPSHIVDSLLAKVGIAAVTLSAGPLNHQVALPNKLFQAISVGVPVVAADLPEIRSVVAAYGLGALYKPGNSQSISDAIGEVTGRFEGYKQAVKRSQDDFDWAVDAGRLKKVYQSLK